MRLKSSASVCSFETFSLFLHTSVYHPFYTCLCQFTFHFLKILISPFCSYVFGILWTVTDTRYGMSCVWNFIFTAISLYCWTKRHCLSSATTKYSTHYGLNGLGLNPGGGEIFCTRPGRLWCPSSLLHNGYRVFPGGGVKAAGAWRWPPSTSSNNSWNVSGFWRQL